MKRLQDITKSELTSKLKGLINDAKNLPIEVLHKAGDYKDNPNLRYPQTPSEDIVAEALSLLLEQDWIDDDPILNEITSVFGQLDTGVNNPSAWQDLFQLAEELKQANPLPSRSLPLRLVDNTQKSRR